MKHNYSIPFLLTCIVFTTSFGQPSVREQKTVGGRYLDYLESISFTKDGGLIAGGSSASNISGEKTQNSRGGKDYWIVKLDRFNKIQWDKTIGGNEDDFLRSVQQTTDGGYILGGYSYSNISAEKTQNSMNIDYWVVKLDSLGNVQWDKTILISRNSDQQSNVQVE